MKIEPIEIYRTLLSSSLLLDAFSEQCEVRDTQKSSKHAQVSQCCSKLQEN